MHDIFLSFSGDDRHIVENYLYEVLRQTSPKCTVFYDKDSIGYGDRISLEIVGEAQSCGTFVAVLSEAYFTRSKSPMMELAASYEVHGGGAWRILPVFLGLKPEHVRQRISDQSLASLWHLWSCWERDEKMSNTNHGNRPSRVQPRLWLEAVSKLTGLRGMVYVPQEYENDVKAVKPFLKTVAQYLGEKFIKEMDPGAQVRAQPNKGAALQAAVQPSSRPGPTVITNNPNVYNDNRQYHQNHPPSAIQTLGYPEPRAAITNQTDCSADVPSAAFLQGDPDSMGDEESLQEASAYHAARLANLKNSRKIVESATAPVKASSHKTPALNPHNPERTVHDNTSPGGVQTSEITDCFSSSDSDDPGPRPLPLKVGDLVRSAPAVAAVTSYRMDHRESFSERKSRNEQDSLAETPAPRLRGNFYAPVRGHHYASRPTAYRMDHRESFSERKSRNEQDSLAETPAPRLRGDFYAPMRGHHYASRPTALSESRRLADVRQPPNT